MKDDNKNVRKVNKNISTLLTMGTTFFLRKKVTPYKLTKKNIFRILHVKSINLTFSDLNFFCIFGGIIKLNIYAYYVYR
jgi:hypothetical protein